MNLIRFINRPLIKIWAGNTFLVMRIVLFIMILSVTQIFAIDTYSQSARINLNISDQSVKTVLAEIQNQSEFSFMFNSKIVDVERKVNIVAEDEKINEVISKLFSNTDIAYTVVDRQIVLFSTKILGEQQQGKKVTGKVTDSSGASLPGVSIVVKGTTKGVITDSAGNYSIADIPENSILQFSFVGMKTQEIAVGSNPTISVTLSEENLSLEEVVAIGYGSQKRASITGSVATVKSDVLTIAPMANVTNTLAGRLPGLIAKQESGAPGEDNTRLSIRGFGSPLIIVDGIETPFSNIDANEIESVSVLKDASAAIYGARAGDGVILVTTKRGLSGKPTITLNSNMTFQGVTYMPELASSGQNAELSRERHLNAGKPESTAKYSQKDVDLFYAGTNPDYPNTDWWNVVARDWAPEQQHNLSIRGGSDKIKYYGFLGFLDQQTMFKKGGGEYQRYNFRSNIDAKILDNLSLQMDVSNIWEDRNFPTYGFNNQSSMWATYWNTSPGSHASLPDPNKIPYTGVGPGLNFVTNKNLAGYFRNQSLDFKASLALKYDFKSVKGLSAKAFANISQASNASKRFAYNPELWTYNYANKTYTQRSNQSNPWMEQFAYRYKTLTGQFSLNYSRTFGPDHELSAMALWEVIDYYNDWISAMREGFKTTTIDYLFAGGIANQTSNGSAFEMGRQSYIGRVNYAYKSKYLLEVTVRSDESAKFSKENRRGIFPSVSLGWRISEEGFLKDNLPILENLKLRASYSQTGKDDVGNFQYLSGYSYALPVQYGNGASYLIGGSASNGLKTTGMPNPLLTWETMTIYNAGLDFALAKNKLYGEFDLFSRDRDGIPGRRTGSFPETFGARLPMENINAINTRGFELVLGHKGRLNDFFWDISANISWSRSKWNHFDEPVYTDPDTERQTKKTGEWTDRLFGYVSEGLFTTQPEIDALPYKYNETQGNVSLKPGDIRFKDINKDGLLNWRDQVEIGTGIPQQWSGGKNGQGTDPHWIGGSKIDLTYKNFNLAAFFQGAFGFSQQVVTDYGDNNYSVLMYNERWTPKNNNANGLIPRLGGAPSNAWKSDFNLIKADYLRLKSVTLSYNLPESWLKKATIQSTRIYVSGTNLFTMSRLNKYSVDPEAPSGLGGFYYPQMRTISIGLSLSF